MTATRIPEHMAQREWRDPKIVQRDEMWNGVIYMPPMANTMHQKLKKQLLVWLTNHWEVKGLRLVYDEANLTTPEDEALWVKNYRIPDAILLDAPRFGIDKGDYLVGAPLVVVEIRSIGDKSYEKLEFYSKLGVPEVWIIDRTSRFVEVFAFTDGAYINTRYDADGWLRSAATGVEFRQTEDGKLRVRLNGDNASICDLPEY